MDSGRTVSSGQCKQKEDRPEMPVTITQLRTRATVDLMTAAGALGLGGQRPTNSPGMTHSLAG
jgi:hypothetical protein